MIALILSMALIIFIVQLFRYRSRPKHVALPADQTKYFLNLAIEEAKSSMLQGKGGPFGALIVKNGQIIAIGTNHVTSLNDPTAHAEIMAIRAACRKLGTFQLTDCELYTSCEPCPMCFGAVYWARLSRVYYAATKLDAARVGFDDSLIYQELQTPEDKRMIVASHVSGCQEKAQRLFKEWEKKDNKIHY